MKLDIDNRTEIKITPMCNCIELDIEDASGRLFLDMIEAILEEEGLAPFLKCFNEVNLKGIEAYIEKEKKDDK